MKCQFCDNPATVHLTDIVNKKKREMHLCEACAASGTCCPTRPAPDRPEGAPDMLMTPLQAGRGRATRRPSRTARRAG